MYKKLVLFILSNSIFGQIHPKLLGQKSDILRISMMMMMIHICDGHALQSEFIMIRLNCEKLMIAATAFCVKFDLWSFAESVPKNSILRLSRQQLTGERNGDTTFPKPSFSCTITTGKSKSNYAHNSLGVHRRAK